METHNQATARGKPGTKDQTLQRNVLGYGRVCQRESHLEAPPHTDRPLFCRGSRRVNASLGTARSRLPFCSQRGPVPRGRPGCFGAAREPAGKGGGDLFLQGGAPESPDVVISSQPTPRPRPACRCLWLQCRRRRAVCLLPGEPSHGAPSCEGSANTSWMAGPTITADAVLLQ